MKKLIPILWLLASVGVRAQIPPPLPASQSEVVAGSVANKYVSPATLMGAGLSSPTNGITSAQATNITKSLVGVGPTSGAGLTNIPLTALQQMPLTNGIYLYPTLIELNGVTFGSEGSGVIAADTIEDLTYANGIDLMSGSFFGNWTLSGNGAAVTNLSGANIQANTINSNKLDAATRALLGGSGSGGTNLLYTSGALTPYVPLSYDASSNVVAGASLSSLIVTNATINGTLTAVNQIANYSSVTNTAYIGGILIVNDDASQIGANNHRFFQVYPAGSQVDLSRSAKLAWSKYYGNGDGAIVNSASADISLLSDGTLGISTNVTVLNTLTASNIVASNNATVNGTLMVNSNATIGGLAIFGTTNSLSFGLVGGTNAFFIINGSHTNAILLP